MVTKPTNGAYQNQSQRILFSTLAGMVPITAILVHFGAELGAIERYSLSAVFKPQMVAALVLVGRLPFVTRALLRLIKNRARAHQEKGL
ncbi:MAG: hypothetical protein ACJAYF_004031 [Arenicella sp.]